MEVSEDVKRKLFSVGVNTFIKYYDEFREGLDNKELIELFEKNSENWSINSARSKINNGKWFFKGDNNNELDALYYIINQANVNKIGIETRAKAIKIYNGYLKDE